MVEIAEKNDANAPIAGTGSPDHLRRDSASA
jgi:hypothetical protein